MRDAFLNCFGLVGSGLIGIALVPIMLHGLGREVYGIWVAATSAAAISALLDPGLGWSLPRAVARSEAFGSSDAWRLTSSIGEVYLIVGTIGAVSIDAFGFLIVPRLHLSVSQAIIARRVFGLLGVAFFGERMLDFGLGVFYGIRRFDLASAICVGRSVLFGVGVIALIVLGHGLVAIAVCYALIWLLVAGIGIALVAHVAPHHRLRLVPMSWAMLGPHIIFGIKSQLTHWMRNVGWSVIPLIVALIGGVEDAAIYYVAQKLPGFLRRTGGYFAQAIFPSASRLANGADKEAAREIVETGLRGILLSATPLFLGLAVFAPEVLKVWVGDAAPVEVTVLRLLLMAAWLDSVAGAPAGLIWGMGAIDKLLLAVVTGALVNVVLSAYLLAEIGIVGAALGTVVVSALVAGTFLHLVSGFTAEDWKRTMANAISGLMLPSAGCVAVLGGARLFGTSGSAAKLISEFLLGGALYLALLLVGGVKPHERVAVARVVAAPARRAMRAIYRVLELSGLYESR